MATSPKTFRSVPSRCKRECRGPSDTHTGRGDMAFSTCGQPCRKDRSNKPSRRPALQTASSQVRPGLHPGHAGLCRGAGSDSGRLQSPESVYQRLALRPLDTWTSTRPFPQQRCRYIARQNSAWSSLPLSPSPCRPPSIETPTLHSSLVTRHSPLATSLPPRHFPFCPRCRGRTLVRRIDSPCLPRASKGPLPLCHSPLKPHPLLPLW